MSDFKFDKTKLVTWLSFVVIIINTVIEFIK